MPPDAITHTCWLDEWRHGDPNAANRLFEAAYLELSGLAVLHLQRARPAHTLQPAVLMDDLCRRLFGEKPVPWKSRAHFVAVASEQLRRLLMAMRAGGRIRLSLTESNGLPEPREADLADLDEALSSLARLDPRSAGIVELRFFGGLTVKEAADVLGISVVTVRRAWDFGRAWLNSQAFHL